MPQPEYAAFRFTVAFAALGLLANLEPARAQSDLRHTRWTTSQVVGTPDPPPPYRAEPAFPHLRFDRPVVLEHAPGADRLFVGELLGRVYSFVNEPGIQRADLAIDLATTWREFAALYGMAFHPDYARNHQVFLFYVTRNDIPEGTRISRFQVLPESPPRIDPASEEVILTFPSGGHNGGCLQFGPDGMLYISAGDSAVPAPPDPLDTGQDLGDLLSSILRIDVDHMDAGRNYRIPPDNPFTKTPGARPEIWAYGFRNPWRMSFDRERGDLWVGDVGWELWELIHRVERGGNYGWSLYEGRQPVRPNSRRGPTPVIAPVVEHPHSEAASITGGYVYRGSKHPDLQGVYIYGDFQTGTIWGLKRAADGTSFTSAGVLAETGLRIVSFGEDEAGELYIVEHERSNQVFHLVRETSAERTKPFPSTLSQTGLFESVAAQSPAPGVIPYEINAEAWTDGLRARRWAALPGSGNLSFEPVRDELWRVPEGTVLVKTLSIEDPADRARSARRVETQLLHFQDGSWRPYTFLWNDEQTDAALVGPGGTHVELSFEDPAAPTGRRQFQYRVAARSECILCHNPWVEARNTVFGRQSASPLAFSTAQLNREERTTNKNQLDEMARGGLFGTGSPFSGRALPKRADPHDENATLDARARAYLHVNCSHCHQFNAGGTATIDLSEGVPLDQTQTLNRQPLQGAFDIDDARIIRPGAPESSVLYYRLAKTGVGHMPRAGTTQVDDRGLRLIGDWIAALKTEDNIDPAQLTNATRAALRESALTSDQIDRLLQRECATTSGALRIARFFNAQDLPTAVVDRAAALARTLSKPESRDLFERYLPASERPRRLGETIDESALLEMSGDAARGREWYSSSAGSNCRTCHTINGAGGHVGPDLSEIGKRYTKAELLKQLIEPSQQIDPQFAATVFATLDGQIHVGVVVERSDRVVRLNDAQGKTTEIKREAIEQETRQTTSLMPQGLLRDLTAQEAADLLAFLASLRE